MASRTLASVLCGGALVDGSAMKLSSETPSGSAFLGFVPRWQTVAAAERRTLNAWNRRPVDLPLVRSESWCKSSKRRRNDGPDKSFKSRIGATRKENEASHPMQLWPGPSSPSEFEFGDEEAHENDTDLQQDGEEKIPSFSGLEPGRDGMEMLRGLESYMEDVDVLEEDEEPAKYVQPSPIPQEDIDMRNRVEEVMYTLKELLPGPLEAIVVDQEKYLALAKLFSETSEFQDPLVCMRGIRSIETWFKTLADAGVAVDLHEIYYENVAADRFKRWVFAVWTATSTNNESDLCEGNNREEPKLDYVLRLSGESKFEVDKSGRVTSVQSKWYKMTENGDQELATAKSWLTQALTRSKIGSI